MVGETRSCISGETKMHGLILYEEIDWKAELCWYQPTKPLLDLRTAKEQVERNDGKRHLVEFPRGIIEWQGPPCTDMISASGRSYCLFHQSERFNEDGSLVGKVCGK